MLQVGTQVRHSSGGQKGIIRFIGEIPELSVTNSKKQSNNTESHQLFAGVEWKQPKGKNDGSVPLLTAINNNNITDPTNNNDLLRHPRKYYFNCQPNHGSFIRLQQQRRQSNTSTSKDDSEILSLSSNLLVPEASLYDVLIDRFSLDDNDDSQNRNNNNGGVIIQISRQKQKQEHPVTSPFYRDPETGAFKNCISVDCNATIDLQVVSSCCRRRNDTTTSPASAAKEHSLSSSSLLTKTFPNLKTVSCSNVLLTSWIEALSIAAQLPNIETFNISDNDFTENDFPSKECRIRNGDMLMKSIFLAASTSNVGCCVAVSTSLRSFNCSNIHEGFSPDFFWYFLEFFPNLKEIFLCHNKNNNVTTNSENDDQKFSEIPEKKFDDENDQNQNQRIAETLFGLEHIALAHNDFETLDSFMKPFSILLNINNLHQRQKTSSMMQTINFSGNPLKKVLSSSSLLQPTSTDSPPPPPPPPPLFPNLTQILIRDTEFRTCQDLLQFFDSRIVNEGSVTDMSLSGVRLFHPEKETTSSTSTSTAAVKQNTATVSSLLLGSSNNNETDPLIRTLLAIDYFNLEEQKRLDSENNDNNNNSSNTTIIASRMFTGHNIFLRKKKHCNNKNDDDNRQNENDDETTKTANNNDDDDHRHHPSALIEETNQDRRKIMIALLPASVLRINNTPVERTNWFGEMKKGIQSSRPIRTEALRWLVIKIFQGLDIIMMDAKQQKSKEDYEKIFQLFPEHLRSLLEEERRERENDGIDDARGKHQIVISQKLLQSNIKLKVATLFPSSTGEILENEDYLRSYFAPWIQNVLKNNKDKQMMLPEIEFDVRLSVAELEEKILSKECLDVNFKAHQSEIYRNVDNWAVLDLGVARWRYEKFSLESQKKTEKVWNWCFPKGRSATLYYVDHEMLENDGAVSRGMHLKALWRPQASLFSFGKISDGDMILVVMN